VSFDLFVYAPGLPADLISQWQQQLARHGLICHFPPGFQFSPWADSYVPVRVQVTPGAFPLAGRYGTHPLLAEFELEVAPSTSEYFAEWKATTLQDIPPTTRPYLERAIQCLYFRTGAGRTPLDLRLQYFAAATLAVITDGVIHDLEEGEYFVGEAALVHAAYMANAYETARTANPEEWQLPLFSDWPS
jgi:hypothetical protein